MSMGFVDLLNETQSIFSRLRDETVALLPRLAGAVAVLLLGFLLARFLRSFVQGVVAALMRLAPARFHVESAPFRPGRVAELSGRFAFWIALLLSFVATIEVLGLSIVRTWSGGMTAYLPRLVVALVIGLCGSVAAVFMRDVVIRGAASARLEHPVLLGQLGYAGILLVTALFAFDQAGFNVWVIGTLIIVVVGILLLGAVVTFGLGAQHLVTNILAFYFLQRVFHVGDRVRVGETEGRILQFTPMLLIIETAEGQAHVPNRSMMEGLSVRILKREEA